MPFEGLPGNLSALSEIDLRQTYERKMKIQCFGQTCPGQTDRRTDRLTPWAPYGAKNPLYKPDIPLHPAVLTVPVVSPAHAFPCYTSPWDLKEGFYLDMHGNWMMRLWIQQSANSRQFYIKVLPCTRVSAGLSSQDSSSFLNSFLLLLAPSA